MKNHWLNAKKSKGPTLRQLISLLDTAHNWEEKEARREHINVKLSRYAFLVACRKGRTAFTLAEIEFVASGARCEAVDAVDAFPRTDNACRYFKDILEEAVERRFDDLCGDFGLRNIINDWADDGEDGDEQ